MIYTYYIAGYTYERPFLNKDLSRKINADKVDICSIPEKVMLILINIDTGQILLKLYGYHRYDNIYHSFKKKSNYFKFTRAIFGIRDVVKCRSLDLHPKTFASKLISYNTCTRKWVKAPKNINVKLNPIAVHGVYELISYYHIRKIYISKETYSTLELWYGIS